MHWLLVKLWCLGSTLNTFTGDYNMPAYDYQCDKCQAIWEETHRMADNALPEGLPCPQCGKKRCVRQVVLSVPGTAIDTAHRVDGKATGGFRDIMQKIASGDGIKGGRVEAAIKRRYL